MFSSQPQQQQVTIQQQQLRPNVTHSIQMNMRPNVMQQPQNQMQQQMQQNMVCPLIVILRFTTFLTQLESNSE